MGKDEQLSHEVLTRLLFDEATYRHDLFWRMVFRWATASLVVMFIPWTSDELRRSFGDAVWVFPVLGGLAALLGGWHVLSEMARYKVVNAKYQELRGKKNRPDWYFEGRLMNSWVVTGPIGWIAVVTLPILLIVLAAVDWYMLVKVG